MRRPGRHERCQRQRCRKSPICLVRCCVSHRRLLVWRAGRGMCPGRTARQPRLVTTALPVRPILSRRRGSHALATSSMGRCKLTPAPCLPTNGRHRKSREPSEKIIALRAVLLLSVFFGAAQSAGAADFNKLFGTWAFARSTPESEHARNPVRRVDVCLRTGGRNRASRRRHDERRPDTHGRQVCERRRKSHRGLRQFGTADHVPDCSTTTTSRGTTTCCSACSRGRNRAVRPHDPDPVAARAGGARKRKAAKPPGRVTLPPPLFAEKPCRTIIPVSGTNCRNM